MFHRPAVTLLMTAAATVAAAAPPVLESARVEEPTAATRWGDARSIVPDIRKPDTGTDVDPAVRTASAIGSMPSDSGALGGLSAPVVLDDRVVDERIVSEAVVEYPAASIDAGGPPCDAIGCDGFGCDTAGCDGCGGGGYHGIFGTGSGLSSLFRGPDPNAFLSTSADRYFGSLELLLLWRRGDTLPALVTTGPPGDSDVAGELGQPGTSILFGGDRLLEDVSAGGRLTLGTFLDDAQCRSLVARAWWGGEISDDFDADDGDFAVLTRPFNNITDGAAVPDTLVASFPDEFEGEITADFDSEIYGGDLSIRQFVGGGLGGTLDVLYGYQYMRLDESLTVRSESTNVIPDDLGNGATLIARDDFDTSNEFHGGMLGAAVRYREGCWIFDGLIKAGFGSLNRRADLLGRQAVVAGGETNLGTGGLLVQPSNAGTVDDNTFAWVPELNLSLSYRRWAGWNYTIGYTLIAMTDAVRVGDVIDPGLNVAPFVADTAGTGIADRRFDDDTFYAQGIHLGISRHY